MWTAGFLAFFLLIFGCQKEIGAGSAAPSFSLLDLSGNVVSLEEHHGKIVLLDFWATWCPPCRMSIPELVKLQDEYRNKGLVVLGISMDDPGRVNDEYLLGFKEKARINYPILRPNMAVIRNYFGHEAPALPTMFVIDREGEIINKVVGFRPGVLEKFLAGLLE